jgi:hypothetical protein
LGSARAWGNVEEGAGCRRQEIAEHRDERPAGERVRDDDVGHVGEPEPGAGERDEQRAVIDDGTPRRLDRERAPAALELPAVERAGAGDAVAHRVVAGQVLGARGPAAGGEVGGARDELPGDVAAGPDRGHVARGELADADSRVEAPARQIDGGIVDGGVHGEPRMRPHQRRHDRLDDERHGHARHGQAQVAGEDAARASSRRAAR